MSAYETGRMADIDEEELQRVSSAEDLARIVDQMAADLEAHPTEWENCNLQRFLEALAAYLPSQRQVYANLGEQYPETATWRLFGDALVAATGYE